LAIAIDCRGSSDGFLRRDVTMPASSFESERRFFTRLQPNLQQIIETLVECALIVAEKSLTTRAETGLLQ
jgi:hypothetical protein